jgi:hypothetical protein
MEALWMFVVGGYMVLELKKGTLDVAEDLMNRHIKLSKI